MELDEVPVWVLDDDDVRYSIQFALSTLGIECVTYSSPSQFFQEVNPNTPGCLIMDTHMSEMPGIKVFDKLRAEDSPIQVIFFSGEAKVSDAVAAMEKGAISYLTKPIYPDELAAKIFEARNRALTAIEHSKARSILDRLTPREAQIFKLNCMGLTSEEIGEKLYLSRRTVEVHRLNILRKCEKMYPYKLLFTLAQDRLPEKIRSPKTRHKCEPQ